MLPVPKHTCMLHYCMVTNSISFCWKVKCEGNCLRFPFVVAFDSLFIRVSKEVAILKNEKLNKTGKKMK